MPNVITYYRRDVYGSSLVYVADTNKGSLLFALTGKKTLSVGDMYALEQLGFVLLEICAPKKDTL